MDPIDWFLRDINEEIDGESLESIEFEKIKNFENHN